MTQRYTTVVSDAHERDEENQWARCLAQGDERVGMLLVFIQKLCTAFHEFEPAHRAGLIPAGDLAFYQRRLARRAAKVLEVAEANDLSGLAGMDALREVIGEIAAARTTEALAELAETVHQINHTLCDALEQVN